MGIVAVLRQIFLHGYSERNYSISQDSIKVYGFDSLEGLTPIYSDTIPYIDSKKIYNYLRGKKLDTLNGEISMQVHHGMKSTIFILGNSLPKVKIVDDFAFEPSIMEILKNVDRLMKDKKNRMFID